MFNIKKVKFNFKYRKNDIISYIFVKINDYNYKE